MNNISTLNLTKLIANDYNLEINKEIRFNYKSFKINPNTGNKKINVSSDAIIVDHEGKEYPYMLDVSKPQRNDEKLKEFNYIKIIRNKSLQEICEEANITLKSHNVKICEGNGWYSNGTRYYYKDFYCDI